MKPIFHPHLTNPPDGDPALYVEFLFGKRGLLFDLGEISNLPARKILRLSHVFVSHAHMDHFMGFDRLLRVCLGRPLAMHLCGPSGFVERVAHKLAGYSWNLVENYTADFTIIATEVEPARLHSTRFRCRAAFAGEDLGCTPLPADGTLVDEPTFRVRAAILDHRIPCLAFALEERRHVNVWKNRLDELALPTGPWLQDLKAAVLRGDPDEAVIRAWWRTPRGVCERSLRLGDLRERVVHLARGQKVGYVVDALYSPENRRRIVDLVRDADYLFIEAAFLDADAERAADKHHLTAAQAGRLARAAGVERLVPFHFSARYEDGGEALRREALQAFNEG